MAFYYPDCLVNWHRPEGNLLPLSDQTPASLSVCPAPASAAGQLNQSEHCWLAASCDF